MIDEQNVETNDIETIDLDDNYDLPVVKDDTANRSVTNWVVAGVATVIGVGITAFAIAKKHGKKLKEKQLERSAEKLRKAGYAVIDPVFNEIKGDDGVDDNVSEE